jgi:hypothetical protein
MLVSQKLAIAAHLHVLLRRKTGRVTDTEWMAGNLEYAMEIVRFSRAKAQEDGHTELIEWADKLERAVLEPTPERRLPLAQTAAQLLRDRSAANRAPAPVPAPPTEAHAPSGYPQSTFGETGFLDSVLDAAKAKPRDPAAPRYVGGIR